METPLISTNKTLVPLSSINIVDHIKMSLAIHCKENNINHKSIYLYYKDFDLHIGFESDLPDELSHITLSTSHWTPTHRS